MRNLKDRHSRSSMAWGLLPVLLIGALFLPPQRALSQPLSPGEMDTAVKLRAEFGLSATLGTIQTASVVGKDPDLALLGIPLSAAEAEDIRARDNRSLLAASMGEALSVAQPDRFGGTWIDQRAGGVIHLGSTEPISQAELATLSNKFLGGSPISYHRVSYSLASLTETKSVLAERIRTQEKIGKWAVQVGVDVKQNRVLLRVDSSVPQPIVDEVKREYENLVVEVTPNGWVTQARDRSSGRLYGGLWMSSRPGKNCTAGYSNALYGSRRVVVTAGHCGLGPWYQGLGADGEYIMGTVRNWWSNGGAGACDCQVIGTLPADRPSSYVAISNSDYYRYTRTATSADYGVGTRICLSGAQYADRHNGGIACGQITDSSASIRYQDGNFNLTDAVITNISGSDAGDSGGPYGSGPTFMGIHAAGYGTPGAFIQTALTKSSRIDDGISLIY